MDAPALHQRIKDQFGERVLHFEEKALQPWIVVAAEAIAEVCAFAKATPELALDNLMCLSAVDYPKETPPRIIALAISGWPHVHFVTPTTLRPCFRQSSTMLRALCSILSRPSVT